jgi:hypothetical protein
MTERPSPTRRFWFGLIQRRRAGGRCPGGNGKMRPSGACQRALRNGGGDGHIGLAPHRSEELCFIGIYKSSQATRVSRRRPRSRNRKWGSGAVEDEDEKEDENDLVAAPPRCAASQSCTLPSVGKLRRVGPIRHSAEYNSAIRQIVRLRFASTAPKAGKSGLRSRPHRTVIQAAVYLLPFRSCLGRNHSVRLAHSRA